MKKIIIFFLFILKLQNSYGIEIDKKAWKQEILYTFLNKPHIFNFAFTSNKNPEFEKYTYESINRVIRTILSENQNFEKWFKFITNKKLRTKTIKKLISIVKIQQTKFLKKLYSKQKTEGILKTLIRFFFLEKEGKTIGKTSVKLIYQQIRLCQTNNTINLDGLLYKDKKLKLLLKPLLELIEPLFNIKIKTLILKNNALLEIPQTIIRLNNLETLDISNNAGVKVPEEIVFLRNIKHICFNHNIWHTIMSQNLLLAPNKNLTFHLINKNHTIQVSDLINLKTSNQIDKNIDKKLKTMSHTSTQTFKIQQYKILNPHNKTKIS